MKNTANTATDDHFSGLYRSLPLPHGSKYIRLLDVHAASSEVGDEDDIQGNLRIVDLDERPSFFALSYVWGTRSPQPDYIVCGPYMLPLTSNCYSALRKLRERLATFTIWIDAICINQEDTDEKSRQISMMGDIFSSAGKVYVWLGEGNATTDRAMAYLANTGFLDFVFVSGEPSSDELKHPRFWSAVRSIYTSHWGLTGHPCLSNGNATKLNMLLQKKLLMQMTKVSEAAHALYDDLNELLSREWIKRIWTYQEVIFASDPVILCGDSILSWSRFALSIVFIDYIELDVHLNMQTTPTIETWRKVAYTRNRLRTNNKTHPTQVPEPQHLDSLRRYEKFLYGVCYRYELSRRVFATVKILLGISLLAGGSILLFKSNLEANFKALIAYLSIVGSSLTVLAAVMKFKSISARFCYQMKFNAEIDDDLINAIYTRKATNPKDLAYGVRSVLQDLSDEKLPDPDYELPTGQIFNELTGQLLQTTKSLKVLLPASICHFPGQPSWVPDWSVEFPNFWVSPLYRAIEPSKRCDNALPKLIANDILMVQGYQVGVITEVLELQATAQSYDERDREVHLRNLEIVERTIRGWGDGAGPLLKSLQTHLNMPSFIEARDLNINGPMTVYHLTKKIRRLLRPRAHSNSLIDAQITLCNRIAQTGIKFFRYACHSTTQSESEQPGRHVPKTRYGAGICSDRTRVGNHIIDFPGAPELMIVRSSGLGDSVELVSPAVIWCIPEAEELPYEGRETPPYTTQWVPLEEFKIS